MFRIVLKRLKLKNIRKQKRTGIKPVLFVLVKLTGSISANKFATMSQATNRWDPVLRKNHRTKRQAQGLPFCSGDPNGIPACAAYPQNSPQDCFLAYGKCAPILGACSIFESRIYRAKKTTGEHLSFFIGDPNGIRTHDTTVKGWCLNRLTMGPRRRSAY